MWLLLCLLSRCKVNNFEHNMQVRAINNVNRLDTYLSIPKHHRNPNILIAEMCNKMYFLIVAFAI